MKNFIYSIPTTAYFGKGQITILGETIKAHGGSRVLLAYGGGSIKENGIYDTILEQFGKAGHPCGAERDQAEPEGGERGGRHQTLSGKPL